jgi:hypothetical protein
VRPQAKNIIFLPTKTTDDIPLVQTTDSEDHGEQVEEPVFQLHVCGPFEALLLTGEKGEMFQRDGSGLIPFLAARGSFVL